MIGLGLLAACTSSPSEPAACFPVPAGAAVLLAEPGQESQGTRLQGGPPGFINNQGTSLQGYSPGYMQGQGPRLQGDSNLMQVQGTNLQGESNIMQQQGTSLQGDSNIMQNQGTRLQGAFNFGGHQGTSLQGAAYEMPLQGTSLQGESSFMSNQGTSLQGESNIMQSQGTSLQGTSNEMTMQGTSLQGESNIMQSQGTSLQGDSNIMEQQGTRLQGGLDRQHQRTQLQGALPGETDQGTHLQGARQQRAYRGLADLNGARLVIAADPSNAVTLQDGQLVARGFADTASLRGTPLTATAPDGRTFPVEVGALTMVDRTQRIEILVEGVPACKPDMQGMFVAGSWDARAAHVDDPAVVTYACMDGVIAKCVDWGYAPWVADATVHASCTRMARADYCGTGTPWTMDGTTIEIYDQLGIHTAPTGGDMKFEAAWGPDGAICVAKSRYQIEDDAGRTVLPGCFATLPKCSGLDAPDAEDAVLANRSKVMPIEACK